MNLLIDTLGSTDVIVVANAAENIVDAIRAYVAPVLMLLFGILSIVFLFKRQLVQFGIFLLIAVLVSIFFFAPEVIKSIAKSLAGETKLEGGDSGW